MLTCTCHNLEQSEFLLIMDSVDGKSSPIISKRASEYINNAFPTTKGTMVYLLCEEMHFQCHNVRAELKRIGDMAFVSKFVCCPIHHEIKLTKPVSWEYHKVNGIPCDVCKVIPITSHPIYFPETKSEWIEKLMKGDV